MTLYSGNLPGTRPKNWQSRMSSTCGPMHPSGCGMNWGLRRVEVVISQTCMLFPITAVVVVVVRRSDQPKPPAIAIIRQNVLSSAGCRASDAVTPMSWQRHVSTPARAGHHPYRLGTDSKDLVCRYITSKSGDMTKQTQSIIAATVNCLQGEGYVLGCVDFYVPFLVEVRELWLLLV